MITNMMKRLMVGGRSLFLNTVFLQSNKISNNNNLTLTFQRFPKTLENNQFFEELRIKVPRITKWYFLRKVLNFVIFIKSSQFSTNNIFTK